MDGDTDPSNGYQSVSFDEGQHILECSITMTDSGFGTEFAGFDGILFTTDTGFVPNEGDGPTTCGDSDQSFTEANCGNNWTNVAPVPSGTGDCLLLDEPDGTFCSSGGDTRCASFPGCGSGWPDPGTCP